MEHTAHTLAENEFIIDVLKIRSCNTVFYTKIQNTCVTDFLRHSLSYLPYPKQ